MFDTTPLKKIDICDKLFIKGKGEVKMELEEIRKQINITDDRIAELFIERMKLCKEVSEYKIKNDLPVFQKDREEQVLQRMNDMFPKNMKESSQVLYQTIMDISKCFQYQQFFSDKNRIESEPVDLNVKCKAAVPGTEGSFSQKSFCQMGK